MARSNTRFKAAFNRMLSELEDLPVGAELPSEAVVAERLGVSRTIVRSVLGELESHGVVRWEGRRKTVLRRPRTRDEFPAGELASAPEVVERRFLEWILRSDVAPGTRLNLRELSRRFGVSPQAVAEFLTGFSRYGLIVRTGRSWTLQGFTRAYAEELSDFRVLVELDAARAFAKLPEAHSVWIELQALREEHLRLCESIETAFHDFSALDDRFHKTVIGVTGNRFAVEFQDRISLIFHYHYQWNKKLERVRNEAAIGEHLIYMNALESRDAARIEAAARAHLSTARETLLASIYGA